MRSIYQINLSSPCRFVNFFYYTLIASPSSGHSEDRKQAESVQLCPFFSLRVLGVLRGEKTEFANGLCHMSIVGRVITRHFLCRILQNAGSRPGLHFPNHATEFVEIAGKCFADELFFFGVEDPSSGGS